MLLILLYKADSAVTSPHHGRNRPGGQALGVDFHFLSFSARIALIAFNTFIALIAFIAFAKGFNTFTAV